MVRPIEVEEAPMARTWRVAVLLLAGCGSSGGGSARPDIASFTASPELVVGDGGTVTLSWSVSGADSASIDHGVGALASPAGGTVSTLIAATTVFTLTATNAGGSVSRVADVKVCDPGPGDLGGTCSIGDVGQCVDFSGLGSTDWGGLESYCVQLGGAWGSAPCPTASRVGTCQEPPLSRGSGITCAASAEVLERYYTPYYTTASAQTLCDGVPGTTFTAN